VAKEPSGLVGNANHAGEVTEPVDQIEAAIEAAANDAIQLATTGYRRDFALICRKHFAGLTFPEVG